MVSQRTPVVKGLKEKRIMSAKENNAAEPAINPGRSVMKYSTGGVFDSAENLAPAIKTLSEKHNILVPGGAIGAELPMLYAAGMSFVFVDIEKETYAIPGKAELGLGKSVLDRIARAAGVRWNPHLCGRTDDGSNPHVVEYQAAGTVLQLDGTESMICASKRIDLRAEQWTPESTWGSDAQEMARIAAGKTPPKEPWPQILQQRQHILSLAETKAKNRAIRTLGVRAAYLPADIAKGFVVLRLQFTGRSEDPELEHEVGLMIAQRALSSQSMLYGQAERRALPPGPPARVPKVAVDQAVDADIVELDEPETKKVEPPAGPSPAPAAAPANAAPAGKAPAAAAPERAKPADDPLLICGDQVDGKWPRKPCSEFAVEVLKAKIFAAEKKRPNWPAQYAAKNEKELLAMKAWRAFKEFDPKFPSFQGVLPGVDETSDEVPF